MAVPCVSGYMIESYSSRNLFYPVACAYKETCVKVWKIFKSAGILDRVDWHLPPFRSGFLPLKIAKAVQIIVGQKKTVLVASRLTSLDYSVLCA